MLNSFAANKLWQTLFIDESDVDKRTISNARISLYSCQSFYQLSILIATNNTALSITTGAHIESSYLATRVYPYDTFILLSIKQQRIKKKQ